MGINCTCHFRSRKNESGDSDKNDYQNASLEEVKKKLSDLDADAMDIKQYLFETPMTAWNEEILKYALQSFQPGRSVFEATEDLTKRIYNDFEYKPGHTTIATPLSVVMKERKGVCQDFAHLAIAMSSFYWFTGSLCQWIYRNHFTRRSGETNWCGCFARLVQRVYSEYGMDRF